MLFGSDWPNSDILAGYDDSFNLAQRYIATRGLKAQQKYFRPLDVYHGKMGRGLSVEMSVKHGPVTLLSVVEDASRGFKLLAAHGECVPGEILHIGNTNSHYQFRIGARGFVEAWNAQGPAHHCAVGLGHIAGKLSKLARLLEIPFVQVC